MCEVPGPDADGPCTFRALIDLLPELVCRFTPDGTLTFVNEAYAAFHDSSPDDMVGRRFIELVPAEIVPRLSEHLHMLQSCTPEAPSRVNVSRVVDPSGAHRWHEWTDTAVFADDAIVGFVAVGRDISERVEAEELSRYHAEHDSLTGLLNRRSTTGALEELVDRAEAGGPNVGVVFVDLDGFKAVNDSHGHQVGDEVLAAVARSMESSVRSGDLVGRIGGDEFVIVTSPTSTIGLQLLTARIQEGLAELEQCVGASIGSALWHPGADHTELLRRADQDMYEMKRRRETRSAI